MAYTDKNFKSKKAVKEAIAAGEEVTFYQPGPFGTDMSTYSGTVFLEGPHYPEPHRWYGNAVARNGVLISIK